MTDFKIGDIIRRKDMLPALSCKIIGENKKWNAWIVNLFIASLSKGIKIECGLVYKDDDRWEIRQTTTNGEKTK